MSDETVIRFLFDPKTIRKRNKWKDTKRIAKYVRMRQNGEQVTDELLEQLQISASRFMTNEKGEYLPQEQAYALFEELSDEEATDAINKFTQAYSESILPNESAGRSNSTSEASSPTPQSSPTGSTS